MASRSRFVSLVVLSLILGTTVTVSHPASNNLNNQPLQSNQLSSSSSGENNGYQQQQQQLPGNSNQLSMKQGQAQGGQGQGGEAGTGVGTYVLRTNLNSQPQYYSAASYSPVQQGYSRESTGSGASPFFGLSSNGEFQLSAYFSQIFWGFVALMVGTALIIFLIRIFFPKESLGGIVQKIKETGAGTGKSIDLDRLTNIVYGALDTYGKWATKEVRDSVHHGKVR